jgi:hypothetical protein
MTAFQILLLGAILLAVIARLAVGVISALGLEVDQSRLRKSLRWGGVVLSGAGVITGSWAWLLLGLAGLGLSHPRVDLPRFRATWTKRWVGRNALRRTGAVSTTLHTSRRSRWCWQDRRTLGIRARCWPSADLAGTY